MPELPPNDAALEVARLRAPALVYVLDEAFRVTFSSGDDLATPAAQEIGEAVRAMQTALDQGDPATWQLDQTRVLRAQRLVGDATTAYVVFVESFSRT